MNDSRRRIGALRGLAERARNDMSAGNDVARLYEDAEAYGLALCVHNGRQPRERRLQHIASSF